MRLISIAPLLLVLVGATTAAAASDDERMPNLRGPDGPHRHPGATEFPKHGNDFDLAAPVKDKDTIQHPSHSDKGGPTKMNPVNDKDTPDTQHPSHSDKDGPTKMNQGAVLVASDADTDTDTGLSGSLVAFLAGENGDSGDTKDGMKKDLSMATIVDGVSGDTSVEFTRAAGGYYHYLQGTESAYGYLHRGTGKYLCAGNCYDIQMFDGADIKPVYDSSTRSLSNVHSRCLWYQEGKSIKNVGCNKVMDVSGGKCKNTPSVIVYIDKATTNQKWASINVNDDDNKVNWNGVSQGSGTPLTSMMVLKFRTRMSFCWKYFGFNGGLVLGTGNPYWSPTSYI